MSLQPELPETLSSTATEAVQILNANDRGTYSVPTQGLYPMQFNWDSAFAALGYRFLDAERAWTELFQLAAAQFPDGMIPHLVFRGQHEGYFPGPDVWDNGQLIPGSGITQPPVLASVARTLDEDCPTQRHNMMVDLLRRLVRWHAWFMQYRLDTVSKAVLIIHPWESGRDNLPDWDQVLQRVPVANLPAYRRSDLGHVDAAQRPTQAQYDRYLSLVYYGRERHWDQQWLHQHSAFRMVDPVMTAILLRANRDLLVLLQRYELYGCLGQVAADIHTLESGWRNLWNPDVRAYTAFDPHLEAHSGSVTSASFLHCYAGVLDRTEHAHSIDHLRRFARRVKFLLPSFDPQADGFDARKYWKGPVWHIINYLVAKGLHECGEERLALRIERDTLTLSEKTGLFEYYDPETGEGLGGKTFTWSAAVYLDRWCRLHQG